VRVANDRWQGIDAIEEIASAPGFFGGVPPQALIQEFVSGREYVVDTVSHAGEHRVLAVCAYDKHPSSTGAMVYDRLRWLEWGSPETALLTAYAFEVLQALDHREGSVHMEIILDAEGPCLIDLGARPHGAGHPLKTHRLTGTSQMHAETDTAAGRDIPRPPGYRLDAHAAIEFLSLVRPATLRADADPGRILRLGFVLSGDIQAWSGTTYPETHSLLDSEALGLVFVSGADEAEVAGNAHEVRDVFASMLEETSGAQ